MLKLVLNTRLLNSVKEIQYAYENTLSFGNNVKIFKIFRNQSTSLILTETNGIPFLLDTLTILSSFSLYLSLSREDILLQIKLNLQGDQNENIVNKILK